MPRAVGPLRPRVEEVPAEVRALVDDRGWFRFHGFFLDSECLAAVERRRQWQLYRNSKRRFLDAYRAAHPDRTDANHAWREAAGV